MKRERTFQRWLWSGAVAVIAATAAVFSGQARLSGAQVATPVVDDQGRGGGAAGPQAAMPVEPLRFRYMGPAPAGRIAAAVGVPGDPNMYYLGSASGGVWKSTDGGTSFLPIFDQQDVAAIGTMAIARTDANTVWVGTGESWIIRPSDIMGDGVYKSTDAGATWKHMGLDETGRIARIIINPTNPSVVYVCAVGRGNGPQQERGVFKSTDGGASWKQTLFVNPDTGCSGLSIDVNDPNTLIAGTWQMVQHTWGEFSGMWKDYKGEPGSGVYISHDAGSTWTKVTAGMPKPPVGKIDVAIAESNSKRMYALIQTPDQGSLWRSDDAGVNWKVVSWDRSLVGRAGYYIRMAVNPQNPDDVLVSSSGFHRSNDGGLTFGERGGGASCGDCHDIWMDPKNPQRYMLTDDGGAAINGPNGVVRVSLPNGQMYHVATDNRVPYWIYSNRQDNGTWRGPSTVSEATGSGVLPPGSLMGQTMGGGGAGAGGGRAGGRGAAPGAAAGAAGAAAQGGGGRGRGGAQLAWESNIGGCESGFTIPDLVDPDIVWATCYGNKLTRYDAKTKTAHSVEPWMITLDSPPNETKYRCHWTSPLAIDPFDHETVYYGCQMLLKTSNKGQTWTEFSPDLSTKDPSRIVSNGGLVGDNLGQYDGEVVWAIAPSTVMRGLIWAGTNDGKLWLTKDGNLPKPTWTDVTKNVPGMPAWSQINQISPSTSNAPGDAGTVYIAVDGHLMDNRLPYIYKTTDFGATWKNVTGDLPAKHPLDYVMTVTENPNRKGMLFAGTAHGFYYSMNDGAHWTRFSEGLPPAPVSWIEVQKTYHDVVISTYGRGLFILPDITIFEQSGNPAAEPSATQMMKPRPFIRLARSSAQSNEFVFSLASAPSGPVQLEVLDSAGRLVKKLQVTGRPGWNKTTWNLQYDGPTLVALKTTPPENPHIWDEPRFQGKDTRTITHWGITAGTGVPLAAPGNYQVRLTVDGKSLPPQSFEIVKDPAIVASTADLQESTRMQLRIRDDITTTSTMVNRMEVWRKQIEDQVKANAGKPAETKALTDLNKQILDTELLLVTRSEMLSDDKYFPEAYKVYMNLIWLSGAVGQGASDEAGGVDWKPTDVQGQVVTMMEKQLATAKLGFDKLVATDIPAFNTANAGKIPAIAIK